MNIFANRILQKHRYNKLGTLLTKYSIEAARKFKKGPFAPVKLEDLGPSYSFITPHKPIDTYPKVCHAVWSSNGSKKISRLFNFQLHYTGYFRDYEHDGKTYADRLGEQSAFF